MNIKPAQTVANLKPYFFAGLNKTLTELKAQGVDIIRLDMGSPDLPPADFIVDRLVNSAWDPKKHGYSPAGGSAGFRKAVSAYYHRRFQVQLDPDREVLALIGSKEGIFNIHHVLLNPGDLVLLPDPYYPVYIAAAQLVNARVHLMPLTRQNNFLPDFDAIPAQVAREAKMMWLNYPNNPTGAVASRAFLEEAVHFARENEIVLVHDAPYTELTFGNYVAPSLLQVPGSKDVAIEFNSLSKTYNMAGWRIGMAVGNAEIIRLLAAYKSQIDSSIFAPILDAGEEALNGDQSWLIGRKKIYEERRDVVYKSLKECGFVLDLPKAALYIWAQLPPKFNDPVTFCDELLRATGVSMTPGIIYGPSGSNYIRISIVIPTDRIKEAMRRMSDWLKTQE